ncbi:uncharacterized protein K489DRAFT_164744 [Dissoconium aciculare CBS 342.82]|uniref:Uncharacterized protein n=1 Tax=Dissoconium aciculare CBS 342.82 TaxID=1314786 RepID=A0A6J3MCC4_9PEZI|nr:uncharacterized protein K489DRAFT_164744 [Dissoconium aciculare CBS 342.82]KAF1825671.1 hypothetical protein K489DRAFT_164744 [Dissoconium aciculare CBS 342.82]
MRCDFSLKLLRLGRLLLLLLLLLHTSHLFCLRNRKKRTKKRTVNDFGDVICYPRNREEKERKEEEGGRGRRLASVRAKITIFRIECRVWSNNGWIETCIDCGISCLMLDVKIWVKNSLETPAGGPRTNSRVARPGQNGTCLARINASVVHRRTQLMTARFPKVRNRS